MIASCEVSWLYSSTGRKRWESGLSFVLCLGENLRLVLISVTEGEDKPLKYPTIFHSADLAVVTKMDLAQAVEFDWHSAYGNIQAVRPGMQVLQLSAKTAEGMEEYLNF